MVNKVEHYSEKQVEVTNNEVQPELGNVSFSGSIDKGLLRQDLYKSSLLASNDTGFQSSADPFENGKPSTLYGYDVAHAYDRQISYYAEQAGVPKSVLKAVVIAEAGGASTDDDFLQGIKSKIDLADQSVGITQIKVGKAWELIHGNRPYSSEDLVAFSNRLQNDPSLAIRAAALHIKESKVKFDSAIKSGGYEVVSNRQISDLAGKEISAKDYNMALLASYNLGPAVLDTSTKQIGDKQVGTVDIFVERARHNYITSTEARSHTQEYMLKELGLTKPSEQELQRAKAWGKFIDGGATSFRVD